MEDNSSEIQSTGDLQSTEDPACASGVFSATSSPSLGVQIAEEKKRIAVEYNLSYEETMGTDEEEGGMMRSRRSSRDLSHDEIQTDQKNWAEFGYDLDYVEKPDEVLSQASQDKQSSSPRMDQEGDGGNLLCRSTLNLMYGLNRFLTNKQAETDPLVAEVAETAALAKQVPLGRFPSDEIPPHVTFDEFLSDDDDDDITDIWSSSVQGLGVATKPLGDVGVSRDENDSDGKKAVEDNPTVTTSKGSTVNRYTQNDARICGIRTKTFIRACAVVLCIALIIICISMVVVNTMDSESKAVSDGSFSDTFNIDDLVESDDFKEFLPTPSPSGFKSDSSTAPQRANPTASSTLAPSSQPLSSPTLPTVVGPTMAPSLAPSTGSPSVWPTTVSPTASCQENPQATFVLNEVSRDCEWLRENALPSLVQSVCEWNEPIRFACRVTCDTCEAFTPTIAPSMAPTETPTLVPTEPPTITPTLIPTVFPTTTPTGFPTGAPSYAPPTAKPTPCSVADTPGVVPGERYTCSWLAQTNPFYRSGQCEAAGSYPGSVAEFCPWACSGCSSS